MGPGLFSDIGKKIEDLISKGYRKSHCFTLCTRTSEKVEVAVLGTKQNDLVLGEILSRIKNKNSTIDIRVSSNSKLVATVILNELMKPGLKGIFRLAVPDQRSGKVEFQYLHEYAGLTVTSGLTTNPVVGMSAVFGTGALSFGADVAYDTATSNFTKYNAGLSFSAAEIVTTLSLSNQGDGLFATYYHKVDPVTAVGGAVMHCFSRNITCMNFAAEHKIGTHTLVKAHVGSSGIVTALLQHAWSPKSILSVSAETHLRDAGSSRILGLSLLLRL